MLQDRQTADTMAGAGGQGGPGQPAQLGRQGRPAGPVPAERTTRSRAVSRDDARRRTAAAPSSSRSPGSRRRCCSATPTSGCSAQLAAGRARRRAALPDAVGEPLRAVVDHLGATPLTELQAEYVETFDTRRRCNLFLTYFAHGDTRKRGMALLRFKQTYLRSGFVLDDDELPDHLCVVLEFAATVDQRARPAAAARPPRRARAAAAGAARRAARRGPAPSRRSAATLPPLRGDERDAVRRLAAEGPPEEEVGLDAVRDARVRPGPAPTRAVLPDADVPGSAPMDELPLGGRPLRLPDRRSWSATSGATATTSSAGPPGPPSSTRTGCCGSAARCSTSASSAVFLGHVDRACGVPKSWTEAVGISERLYHFLAVVGRRRSPGSHLVGMAILIYRRRTVGPVFSATTRMDKVDVRRPGRR